MDKNAIKKYATWARRELISRVSQKAAFYEITEKDHGNIGAENIGGRVLNAAEKKQRDALIRLINKDGYEQAMEEVAYTWFNRFCALRYMEVNNYLPSHVRVFTDDEGAFKPQILSEAINLELDGLDMDLVYAYKENNELEKLYRYLLIVQCNALNSILPGIFQTIEDYTELLLPDNLLREGSVIEQMVALIPEEDWTDQVQIIGWLYQYYNAEKKDEVFAALKKNVKITKENIPAATQLFTPDWIVRYMVENSLGRLWVEGHPNDALKSNWKYYLDEAEQEPDVQVQLNKIREEYAALNPQDIRCVDPCMGSGHILVYMFDVLVQIYEAYGYSARDAARSIVENNLYGLDIDERAAQLAYFSVMMKARSYDRRFFGRGCKPKVYAIRESNDVDPHALTYFVNGDPELKKAMDSIIKDMHDAKEYGSIINVGTVEFSALYARFDEIIDDVHMYQKYCMDELLPLVQAAEALAQKYEVVCTNPPYMGLRNMSKPLFDYVMNNYPMVKNDLYGVFMERALKSFANRGAYVSMITQHVWMFTSGFEKFRNELYGKYTLSTLVHLGTRAFEEISGEVVQTSAFVFNSYRVEKYQTKFVRLVQEQNAERKREAFLEGNYQYLQCVDNLNVVPGKPVCYWLSSSVLKAYEENPLIGDVSTTRQGLKTSDDKRFVRFFYEVDQNKIAQQISSIDQAASCGKKWFWLNKGGQIKWFGNNIYVINWENDGKEVKDYAIKVAGSYSKNITAIDAYFKECISWPQISISHPSFRYIPKGFIFASAGPSLFTNDPELKWYFIGLLNSCVTQEILDAINPTINFGVSDILKLPFIYSEEYKERVAHLAKNCVDIAEDDYNSYELSWYFKRHPLVRPVSTIAMAFSDWCKECEDRFARLKANEKELNEIFISIYDLQNEISSEVDDSSMTVQKADLQREVKGLISYSVGCMFGRYSLDCDGLAYAGGEWDASKYKTFAADEDNIIPICDDEYFADDIVGRFVDFIKVVYGNEKLDENLRFIADALGNGGQPKEVIRNYFLNDFYNDHLKTYQKRPIYWLFDSGKKNGFKALIYVHRYRSDTIARIRTDYVHEQQSRYRTAIADLEKRVANTPTSERVKLNKQLTRIQGQANELRGYEEKIHHLADQMISIDLDDGVKNNYDIFKDVLAKIK